MKTMDSTVPITAKEVILVTYLLYCFCVSKVDLTSFKKLGVDPSAKNSQVWCNRMLSHREEFQKAALTWAGIHQDADLSSVSPFWDGVTPPTVFSIPHLAAQDILERVPLPYFKSDPQYPAVTLTMVENACEFPVGFLRAFETRMKHTRRKQSSQGFLGDFQTRLLELFTKK